MVSQKPKYCKNFERNSHWRKLSMLMVWKLYCKSSPKPEYSCYFLCFIFIHISANMSPFELIFSQMILNAETSKLMYNWSFLFVVLYKPTLLPSTFNAAAAVTSSRKAVPQESRETIFTKRVTTSLQSQGLFTGLRFIMTTESTWTLRAMYRLVGSRL